MESLVQSKSNCKLRRIDIVSWKSDVARQFGINRLPTVWLYNGQHRVSSDSRDVFARVQWL